MSEPSELKLLQTILNIIASFFGSLMDFLTGLIQNIIRLVAPVIKWFLATPFGQWLVSLATTLGTVLAVVLAVWDQIMQVIGGALTTLFPSLPWGSGFQSFPQLSVVNYFLPLDVVCICLGVIVVYMPVCWGIRIIKSFAPTIA